MSRLKPEDFRWLPDAPRKSMQHECDMARLGIGPRHKGLTAHLSIMSLDLTDEETTARHAAEVGDRR
jgi:hypothetical protein